MDIEGIFTRIYRENGWFQADTVSGSGSAIFNTVAIREELPIVIQELGVRSILDIPCGDCHWMKELNLPIEHYMGADIVKEIIDTNRQHITDKRYQFFHWDITQTSLPTVDFVLCRDCLVHFALSDAQRTIENILRSRSRYFATTTFPSVMSNMDIVTGDWRPINLLKAPFHFPEPMRLIKEHHLWHGEEHTDKSLGVWRVEDLTSLFRGR